MVRRIDWRGQQKQAVRYSQVDVSPYVVVDFPPNPSIGDQFLAPNGSTYEWDGTVWVGVYLPNNNLLVPISINPPVGAQVGQLWWRNDPDGNLYILYNDGNSTQWVPAAQPNSNASGSAGIPDAPNDGQRYVRQSGAWVVLP
jgi:Fibritin C-terminal region